MLSLWEAESNLPYFQQLKGEIETDTLIIGGGAAGILTAYKLKNAGVNYVLVEADRICKGVTAGTTAKITFQHGLIYNKLIKTLGKEKAQMYLDANRQAVEEYKELCQGIDCDFTEVDSYIYSMYNVEKLKKEISALKKLGCNAEFCNSVPLPFQTVGGVRITGQGQFNPLKFFGSIAKELNIYEKTAVKELKGMMAVTDNGVVKAKRIVVATHFPFINKHGSYFLKMHQKRSYVAAFTGMPHVEGIFRDEAEEGFSFRDYKGYVIIGGESKRTGSETAGWDNIEKMVREKYPSAKLKYKWAAQDCITLDDMPYVGNYSACTPDLYVITGFNKWGMTGSMVGANLLCDMLTQRKSPYQKLLSPSRSMLRWKIVTNGLTSTGNLLCPKTPRCPHLGCSLKWNSQEKSWDCPCHGSRFREDGKLLDNPATSDLKAKKQKRLDNFRQKH